MSSLSKESIVQLEEMPAGEVRVVSSGAACRMQIKQGTGMQAIHPILLVANLVNEWNSHDKK